MIAPTDEDARQLGLTFRNARERKGVSLRVLSAGARLSVNTLRSHESGKRPLRAHHLCRAARAMGVRPGLLLHVMEEKGDGESR